MDTVLGVQNDYNDYSVGKKLYDCSERDWFISVTIKNMLLLKKM